MATLPGLDVEPWMRGAGGERIVLCNPAATEISLPTIAAVLAKVCRFGGHCTRFYSVAEHSLHVSHLLEASHGREAAIYGLLHDAHEAYTGDCPTPVKYLIGQTWEDFESQWQQRVADHFGLAKPRKKLADAIKNADHVALATEMRKNMTIDDSREILGVEPDEYWDCIGGLGAEKAFLERAEYLGIKDGA